MSDYKHAQLWQIKITHPADPDNTRRRFAHEETIGVVATSMERALLAIRERFPKCRFDRAEAQAPAHIIMDRPDVVDVVNRLNGGP